jgi:hypothetical protein
MLPPEEFNPAMWGFVAALSVGALFMVSLFFPVEHQPFTMSSAGTIAGAFGWGFISCLVVNNLRHWLWKRSTAPRRGR